jgi:hypothetical protein
MRASKGVLLTAPSFGAFFWLRFNGQSGPCCARYPNFGFFFCIFWLPTSTIVTHYESLQGGAVDGTLLWGIFLASVQWPFRAVLCEVSKFWVFFCIFWLPTSAIVTHYESLQGGAVDGTLLWGILWASVQWPIRALLCEVSKFWFFFCIFWLPTSAIVMHYESLQGGAVDGTLLWGIFLASVQWPFRAVLCEVSKFWVFFCIFWLPTSAIVTHYESLQGGAVHGTLLWGIFLASVQWPFRALLCEVSKFWFFFWHFLATYEHDSYALWEPPRGCR